MKKLFSALLVLVMLLSLPGIAAFAASDELTWSLDKDGTLTVSGKGKMPDYYSDTPPWEKYKDDIKAVVIEDGVTHVGDQSFQYCFKLKSVVLPSSVESIGKAAFFRCGKLTEIGLPAGLTEIADQTFDHCASLTSVFIPSGVTEIGESAFNCCSALKTVDIPASVKSIGYSAFNSCKKLETVYYSGSTSDWEKIEIGGYNKRLLDADLITSGLESPAPASSGSSIAGGKLK